MSKERALTILRQYLEQAENEEAWLAEHDMPGEDIRSASEDAEALRMAIASLEKQTWILVAEKLPKTGAPVLLSRPKNGTKIVEQAEKDVGDWWRVYGTRVKKVDAWMPMPEPYCEEVE